MGIPKLQKVVMLAVNLFSLFVLFLSCVAIKHEKSKLTNDKYILKRYSSNDTFNYLSLDFYDYEDKIKKLPASFVINGIMFLPTIENDSIKTFRISVLPGKYNIEGIFIGKKRFETNSLIIKNGDSIYLKVYLEDDSEPLINNEYLPFQKNKKSKGN